jgi:hypothetical protein
MIGALMESAAAVWGTSAASAASNRGMTVEKGRIRDDAMIGKRATGEAVAPRPQRESAVAEQRSRVLENMVLSVNVFLF